MGPMLRPRPYQSHLPRHRHTTIERYLRVVQTFRPLQPVNHDAARPLVPHPCEASLETPAGAYCTVNAGFERKGTLEVLFTMRRLEGEIMSMALPMIR